MRYLLILLLLAGCGGETQKEVKSETSWIKQDLGELLIRDPSVNGGTTERNGDNWYFESHTNLDCIGALKGSCRKADVVATEGLTVPDRIVKYKFTMNVVEYPEHNPPEFVIVFQDWTRIIDGLSNHPITTLKLIYNNGLMLCSYNNSWQFEWTKPDWGHVPDGSVHDHPPEELNGCVNIDIGVDHDIEFYIYDNGRVKLYLDEKFVFDKSYQTKSPEKEHIYSWGLYWSKGYNLEFNPTSRVILTIEGFGRYEPNSYP